MNEGLIRRLRSGVFAYWRRRCVAFTKKLRPADHEFALAAQMTAIFDYPIDLAWLLHCNEAVPVAQGPLILLPEKTESTEGLRVSDRHFLVRVEQVNSLSEIWTMVVNRRQYRVAVNNAEAFITICKKLNSPPV